jgi:hypothetical protein
VLNLSAGDDGGRADHARRVALAAVGAEMVSLAAGSFNAGSRLYDNAPAFQGRQARAVAEAGAVPELEVFDTGQLNGLHALLAEGAVRRPPALCLVFGVPGGMPADPALLRWLAPRLPPDALWCVSAQGEDAEAADALLDAALALGGHVRTGHRGQPLALTRHPRPFLRGPDRTLGGPRPRRWASGGHGQGGAGCPRPPGACGMMRRRTLLAATASALAFPARAALPVGPIRVVVPFAPGGAIDAIGRALARRMGEGTGRSFVVENRAGAGGTLGAAAVARAAPDGTTLLVSELGANAAAPAVFVNLPYDPVRDFAHLLIAA